MSAGFTFSFDALKKGVEIIIIPKSVTNINGNLYTGRYDLTFLVGLIIAFVGLVIALVVTATLKIAKIFVRMKMLFNAESVFHGF